MKIKPSSRKKLHLNLRWHALVLLDKIENNNQYSNVVINQHLQDSPLDERDQRLMVQIIYGVIQHRYTIDYYLSNITKGKKLDPWIRTLLRLSVYQLVFLDRIPDHAVVNEAVVIAKTNGHQKLGNFVNALLRQFMRQPLLDIDRIDNPTKRLSIKYSIEPWIVDYFAQMMPLEELVEMLASLQKEAHLSARINGRKGSRAEIIALLEEENIKVSKSALSPEGLRLDSGDLINSEAFKEGLITIQDESSMLVAPLGDIQGHERILDACSAPGGKATHIASKLTTGQLTALDISEVKLKQVAEHMERMGLSKLVKLLPIDATQYFPENKQLYDIIYLDAPCSGLGLMRRKPEIKYQKSMNDVHNLVKIQTELINHLATLVKPGGKLVYSTCTLTTEENEALINSFLQTHDDFMLDPISEEEGLPSNVITSEGQVKVWPHIYETDGFYICRLIKKDTGNIN